MLSHFFINLLEHCHFVVNGTGLELVWLHIWSNGRQLLKENRMIQFKLFNFSTLKSPNWKVFHFSPFFIWSENNTSYFVLFLLKASRTSGTLSNLWHQFTDVFTNLKHRFFGWKQLIKIMIIKKKPLFWCLYWILETNTFATNI